MIYHSFEKKNEDSINNDGLVLNHAYNTSQRIISHMFNFFRAPANNVGNIPSKNPTINEVNQNYEAKMNNAETYFCIRIDPEKTRVYLSEARVVYYGTEMWKNSGKTLTEYQKLCKENKSRQGDFYHALSGIRSSVKNLHTVEAPPERNGEILVKCNIPPSWRVHIHP